MSTPVTAGPTGPVVMEAAVLGSPILIPPAFAPGAVATYIGVPAPGYALGDAAQLLVDGPIGVVGGLVFQVAFNAPGLADVQITNASAAPNPGGTVNGVLLLWKTSNLL